MITGETEAIINAYEYDDFLFGNKETRLARRKLRKTKRASNRLVKKANRLERRTLRLSSPVREIKRQRRKNFFMDLGDVYKNVRGAAGIGQKIDSITDQTPNYGTSGIASDYTMSLGSTTPPEDKKPRVPKIAYIAGGVLVVGIIGMLALKKNTTQY